MVSWNGRPICDFDFLKAFYYWQNAKTRLLIWLEINLFVHLLKILNIELLIFIYGFKIFFKTKPWNSPRRIFKIVPGIFKKPDPVSTTDYYWIFWFSWPGVRVSFYTKSARSLTKRSWCLLNTAVLIFFFLLLYINIYILFYNIFKR